MQKLIILALTGLIAVTQLKGVVLQPKFKTERTKAKDVSFASENKKVDSDTSIKLNKKEFIIYKNFYTLKEKHTQTFWVEYNPETRTFENHKNDLVETSIPWFRISFVLFVLFVFCLTIGLFLKTTVKIFIACYMMTDLYHNIKPSKLDIFIWILLSSIIINMISGIFFLLLFKNGELVHLNEYDGRLALYVYRIIAGMILIIISHYFSKFIPTIKNIQEQLNMQLKN